ncbi:hypothetical protein Tcan_01490, partial [Toxocara canis]
RERTDENCFSCTIVRHITCRVFSTFRKPIIATILCEMCIARKISCAVNSSDNCGRMTALGLTEPVRTPIAYDELLNYRVVYVGTLCIVTSLLCSDVLRLPAPSILRLPAPSILRLPAPSILRLPAPSILRLPAPS